MLIWWSYLCIRRSSYALESSRNLRKLQVLIHKSGLECLLWLISFSGILIHRDHCSHPHAVRGSTWVLGREGMCQVSQRGGGWASKGTQTPGLFVQAQHPIVSKGLKASFVEFTAATRYLNSAWHRVGAYYILLSEEMIDTTGWGTLGPSFAFRQRFLYQYIYFKISGAAPVAQRFGASCSLGCDPGVPGSSPTSGSLHGACFSLCLCLCLFLSVSMNK